MHYTYPTKFYFAHLEGVNCVRGIIINDDHARYPYLSLYKSTPENGFFEMEVEHFTDRATIDQPIGIFEAHEFEGQKFYCSEPHINKIFDLNTKIAENNVRLITEHYRSTIKSTFYKGYADSIKLSILTQLGEEFSNLPLDQKILKLSEFCKYCKDLSYFEGFAIPRVIYCVGFIQAAYFKAYAELVGLKAFSESTKDSKDSILKELPIDQSDFAKLGESILEGDISILGKSEHLIITPSEDARIPIAFPLEELRIIWMTILEIPRCKTLKVHNVEIDPELINLLLYELFDHPLVVNSCTDTVKNSVCNRFDQSWKVPIGGLLYATKKRNEKSGMATGNLSYYENFATNKFVNSFIKEESNSKGSNLGRSFERLKKKLKKYNDANFPNIKETLNLLTKYHL